MTRLTDEQRGRLTELAQEWKEETSLTSSVQRWAMEDAVLELYGLARLQTPKHFVWTTNPKEFEATKDKLRALYEETEYLPTPPLEMASDKVPANLANTWFDFRGEIDRDMFQKRTGLTTWVMLNTYTKAVTKQEPSPYYWSSYVRDGVESCGSNLTTEKVRHAVGGSGTLFDGVFARKHVFHLIGYHELIQGLGESLPYNQFRALSAIQRTAMFGGLWHPFEGGVILCENPTSVVVNNQGEPNNLDGPAVEYADGHKEYYINGVSVPEKMIVSPKDITIEEVLAQTNTEIRRIMIERMGVDTFLKRSDAKLVNEDAVHGKLWQTEVLKDDTYWTRPTRTNRWTSEEVVRPAAFLEVQNSSPEPDGTYRTFFLRVPGRYKTAHGARAWMFGVKKNEFSLAVET